MKAYTVKALDESTWAAFAELVERNNGVFGGCWCMGFHPEGVGKDTTYDMNRERKLERVRAGTTRAALVFDGDDCVGWCQFGAPSELPRIKSRAAYEKGATVPTDWRIACNFVGKGHRRQGVATAGLKGALDLIAGLGGGTVEGYPEDAATVPAGFLFNGALSTYEALGFVRDRKIGKHRGWSPRSSSRASNVPEAGVRTGGCLCGAVRYSVRGEPVRVRRCHCTSCRKESGSAFTVYAQWPADAFEISGELASYDGRGFCPTCGSRLIDTSDPGGALIEIRLGSLDEAPFELQPQDEIWVKRRESWIPPVEGAAQHDESWRTSLAPKQA